MLMCPPDLRGWVDKHQFACSENLTLVLSSYDIPILFVLSFLLLYNELYMRALGKIGLANRATLVK